jgi:hypothetical protein
LTTLDSNRTVAAGDGHGAASEMGSTRVDSDRCRSGLAGDGDDGVEGGTMWARAAEL